MKFIVAIILIVAIAGFALSSGKDILAKSTVEGIAHMATGLDLKVRSLHLGILTSLVDIRGINLMNPSGFKDRIMFDFPEIFVNLKILELFGGKVHIEEARFNLAEITIVKNKDGKLNLDYLKPKSQPKQAAKPAQPSEAAKPGKSSKIVIDVLELKVGRVVYKDYTAGAEPRVETFDINLNERHENIQNIQVLIPLIVTRALMNTSVGQLTGLDMNKFVSQFDLEGANLDELGLKQFEGVLKQFGDGSKDGAAKAVEGVKNLLGAFGEAK